MCAVSMIADDWMSRHNAWPKAIQQLPAKPNDDSELCREVEALRKEVKALKDLLKAAKEYDAQTGQPDCEMDEKVAAIRRIAEMVGVDVSDVFDQPAHEGG